MIPKRTFEKNKRLLKMCGGIKIKI